MSLQSQETEIDTASHTTRGVLMMADGAWVFSSTDPGFLSLFPSGSVYSFSAMQEGEEKSRHAEFYKAILQKVAGFRQN